MLTPYTPIEFLYFKDIIMQEEWKDVKDFEGIYQVSNLGRIKSLDRYIKHKHTYKQFKKGRIFKERNDGNYVTVTLYKDDLIRKVAIHRLVAEAFIPNPDNLPEINHKDENKSNNCVNNLEWCTHKYNINYGTCKKRISQTLTGTHLSEETKRKISKNSGKSFLGKHHTEETKKLQSQAKLGNNNPMYGRKHSEETKQKMRLKAIEREARRRCNKDG